MVSAWRKRELIFFELEGVYIVLLLMSLAMVGNISYTVVYHQQGISRMCTQFVLLSE